MTEDEIPDYNIFMMCEQLNEKALIQINKDYYLRNCKPSELDIWKSFPFDSIDLAKDYEDFMTQYFIETYGNNENLFFENTFFICDKNDNPIATCSTWKAYNKFNTIQWFKTLKSYEGKGIGRALFSLIMKRFDKDDYPIFLHTQPSSYRAIKLYSDFGFCILSDTQIGNRKNDLEISLPIFKEFMPKIEFDKLKIITAPNSFIQSLQNETSIQF
jgi:ribosomal protein S18 acetylase RimI-like enzyme